MNLYILFILAIIFACKGEMGSRQQAALEAKRAEIWAEVHKTLDAWVQEMQRTLPKDTKKYPKIKSPLVEWRLEGFKFDFRRPLKSAEGASRNYPFNNEFKAVLEFFDAMERFWKKEIEFKDYLEAYNILVSNIKDQKVRHLADFDQTFLHVEAFYGSQDMPDQDTKAIYFFRHWQVAFRFPREKAESVSEYLARLCKEKLKNFCKDIPFENMHFAIEGPYLEEVKRITQEFLDRYPDSPFRVVFEPFLVSVSERLQKVPTFIEDPVMPSSISKADFVGDLVFVVSRKGMEYENSTYLNFEKSWFASKADWAKFETQMKPLQEKLEKERGPENMEILLVAMDQEAPMDIPAQLVSIFRKHAARYIQFGARRRIDGINKRTVVGNLQFREIKGENRQIGIQGKTIRCKLLGLSVDDDTFSDKIKIVAVVEKDRFLLGRFENNKVVDLKNVDQSEVIRALTSNEGLILAMSDCPYARFLLILEGISLRCEDNACQNVKALGPKIEVQICGGSY